MTVAAAYTKNGETATLPVPRDLANDLAAYVASLPAGKPIFTLPEGKRAKMLRVDLKAAGILYRDASGLFFDFHSLRCQTATLADAAGVSPRVVQKIMRHSSLELTGRYTQARAVDIEAAAGVLPFLKPEGDKPEAIVATRTDGQPISRDFSLLLPYSGDVSVRCETLTDVITDLDALTCMMQASLENEGLDASGRVHSGCVIQESAARIRTGDEGFADLCLTTWLRRQDPRTKKPVRAKAIFVALLDFLSVRRANNDSTFHGL